MDALHTPGRMHRRTVLKRATAMAMGGSAVAALLAACGGSTAPTATTGAAATTATGAGAGAATSAPKTGSAPAASVAAAGSPAASVSAGQGVRGGTLNVALIGEPPTLDIHQTTASITFYVGWTMFEALFTWDANYQLIPLLAESHNVSTDQLTQTIKLRKGVKFHNGQEMKAADVLASIQRWAGKSGVGKSVLAATDTINTPDDYTVEFKLKKPYGTLSLALSQVSQGCAIMPKSVIDETGTGQLAKFVGTGPYQLGDRQPDRFIRVDRFNDYSPLPGDANGLGGHKFQYLDAIKFIPVPDESARVAGMLAGDYDVLEDVGADQQDKLKSNPNVVASVVTQQGWDVFFLNYKSPMMSNLKMRQAFQAALSHEPIMAAGRGKGFYDLNPSLMWKKTPWYNDAGKELYNLHSVDKTKSLLKDAGYAGTPLRFMSTQQYPWMANEAIVAKQQLEEAGFKVDLQIYDWATVVDRRGKADLWDAFTTGHGFVPDPSQLTVIGQIGTYPGFWSDEPTKGLVDQLLAEADMSKRLQTWQQVQTNFYQTVPAIKLGDQSGLNARSSRIGGWTDQIDLGTPFWNLWLKK
ncbi:MAG: ABC transporter substrate-binding protein [Chloroflexota bacterium]|nr:ABC transporter substrate-binding protein [Chloroflexota bacterium]